jgi:hypothetical protein
MLVWCRSTASGDKRRLLAGRGDCMEVAVHRVERNIEDAESGWGKAKVTSADQGARPVSI